MCCRTFRILSRSTVGDVSFLRVSLQHLVEIVAAYCPDCSRTHDGVKRGTVSKIEVSASVRHAAPCTRSEFQTNTNE